VENKTPLAVLLALAATSIAAALAAATPTGFQQRKNVVPQPPATSFRVNIHPLLTRHGCTQGACHGSAAGRGGLRLSLLGGNPDADFTTIVDSANGRLVSGATPDDTLLLQKASGQLNHGGGERFAVGSAPYKTLKAWLANDMHAPADADVIKDIYVDADVAVLQPGAKANIRVSALTNSGATVDVTQNAIFDSLDDGTASIAATGRLSAIRPGIARIMIRFEGHTKAIAFTVPLNASTRPLPPLPKIGIIDQEVGRTHQALRAAPSQRASDASLLRRIHFDTTGIAPTAEQEAKFSIAYDSKSGMQTYISTLLASPDANIRWTRVLVDALRVDSARIGPDAARRYTAFLHAAVTADRPWDKTVAALLQARPKADGGPDAAFWMTYRDPRDLAEFTAQTLFGKKVACARCHQHPYDKWTVNDNVAYATLFAGKRLVGNTIISDPLNTIPHPETGATLPARLLGSAQPNPSATLTQDILAASALGNRDLATQFVNRTWKELFGKGLVEPIDDIRPGNPSRFPRLLTSLTDAFMQNGMRIKWLVYTILMSETYQQQASPKPDAFREAHLLTHAKRRLTAEMLDDLITHTAGSPNPAATGSAMRELDHRIPNTTLDAFDRCQRDGRTPDVSPDAEGLTAALHRLAAPEIQKRIAAGAAALASTNSSLESITRQLFQRALTRPVTQAEWNILHKMQHQQPRAQAIEDTLWVIINHPEFGGRP